MLRSFSWFVIPVLVGISFMSQAQDDVCAIDNVALKIGEEITYKVYYQWFAIWINAGEVTFSVESANIFNKSCYHFKGVGRTYKAYDWFYKVRDTYESFVEINSFQPVKFLRDVYEGGYVIKDNITFDHETHKATSAKKTIDIPLCFQDVLSSIYYARNLDFSSMNINDTVPMQVYIDDEMFPIYIRYMGKEKIKTKLGTFRCIKFKPLLVEGTMFTGGEKMMVYVTDDDNRIPVRVESPIIVGSIIADLISFKNLKN
ncbi:MAG: DUF3108 domain-containing protein, partial [Bacteroidetes bacterium]|nr:DUF3108 domain-containing protein [Bacteroidota bacterium]